ncbi:MAG: YvcK family protein, partial [Sciscionella sp.]|nr:YvcK family protein [Sciscionella sp.]
DLRKALVSLAGAENPLWANVFRHRFGGDGALAGHAVGNLVLAGLFEVLHDPIAGLDAACRLLGVRGRVLPMCAQPLDIEADVVGLDADLDAVRRIRGQVAVATTPGTVLRIRLHGSGHVDGSGSVDGTGDHAKPVACQEAVDAVRAADVVLLGPGSWFTSVLPHLLVPALRDALLATTARKIVVLNLVPQPGETTGFAPHRYLDVLYEHAPELRVDTVIADTDSVGEPERLRAAADILGATVLLDSVAMADGATDGADRHDPVALAASLAKALAQSRRT